MRRMIRLAVLAALLAPTTFLAGCRSNAETGALIGAGAGALGGYAIGNEMDKSRDHHHHRHYYYR
jgi:hypothetical protein